jgi:hypothetical protein
MRFMYAGRHRMCVFPKARDRAADFGEPRGD